MATHESIPKIWILLNRKATENLICKNQLIKNIPTSKNGCQIFGSTWNKVTDEVASLVMVSQVVFDHDGPKNVHLLQSWETNLELL